MITQNEINESFKNLFELSKKNKFNSKIDILIYDLYKKYKFGIMNMYINKNNTLEELILRMNNPYICIVNLIKKMKNITIFPKKLHKNGYIKKMSTCCQKKIILVANNIYECVECHKIDIEENINIHFDNNYTYMKKRKYNIEKNIQKWLNLIQINIKKRIPLYVLDIIEKNASKPYQCYKIRNILKNEKLSTYYKYIPLIIYKLSGEKISFSYIEINEIIKYAIRFIKKYKKQSGKNNSLYIPFIILKTIENLWPNDERIQLYKQIIYIQKKESINRHNKLFKLYTS